MTDKEYASALKSRQVAMYVDATRIDDRARRAEKYGNPALSERCGLASERLYRRSRVLYWRWAKVMRRVYGPWNPPTY